MPKESTQVPAKKAAVKKVVAKKAVAKKATKKTVPKTAAAAEQSAKELATAAGEPYVAILGFDVDPANLHQGAFELDWNDKFIANLVRAGYRIKDNDTDADIVDRWFQNVCRHVVMETWEQEQAMRSGQGSRSRNLGNGRREVS
jgi:hypothetical protein